MATPVVTKLIELFNTKEFPTERQMRNIIRIPMTEDEANTVVGELRANNPRSYNYFGTFLRANYRDIIDVR